jgi:anti-sigma B factor antagonist
MSQIAMSTRKAGTATVVEFGPNTNLNAAAVEDVDGRLAEVIEQGRGPLVLDLSSIAFASSPAIGLLVTLRLKAARTERRLALAGLRDTIQGVLDVMQMSQLFEIHKTVADALKAVQAAG